MTSEPRFEAAFPYQEDVLALPVADIDAAAQWYTSHFGMEEVERRTQPHPTVILERDGTRIGFAVNGGDATKDGAAIRVSGVGDLRSQLAARGVQVGELSADENDGRRSDVFYVVAPDGLCYYFFEPH
jgi:catechol 2,3-dioxygenase-like lactoylglutathione lyase family enzyme